MINKYYKQQLYKSTDSGHSWTAMDVYQMGAIMELEGDDCSPKFRTVSGTPYCDGYNRCINLITEVSYDGGDTWEYIASKSVVVERNSVECGFPTYLTFVAKESGNFWFEPIWSGEYQGLYYSLDDGETWAFLDTPWIMTPRVNAGQRIMWKAEYDSSKRLGTFNSNCDFEVIGTPMSLIYGDDFMNHRDLSGKDYVFWRLFMGCTKLISAENMSLYATNISNTSRCCAQMFDGCTRLTKAPRILTPTSLGSECYWEMFYGCTSLTTAPELPATNLENQCYTYMFEGCTSLTTAPELPATTMAIYCYGGMFKGCTSLTTAPELPATSLANGFDCYEGMFEGCTSLTTAPLLNATTISMGCYQGMFKDCTSLTTVQSVLPATSLFYGCYTGMFQGCTSLTTAPSLPAERMSPYCYYAMFSGCTSLTTAPALPATILHWEGESCYNSMFEGCTSLTTAPTLSSQGLADYCYSNMFKGCTSLTTAPDLLVSSLRQGCYENMFSGCTSLNYVKCTATDVTASNCTSNWLSGVAQYGTFVKDASMSVVTTSTQGNYWILGSSGCPSYWTVQDA